LWQLLLIITDRKALKLVDHQRRAKRGGGKVLDEGALAESELAPAGTAFARFPSREPTPEFTAQVTEEFQRLLDRLADEQLRAIALWKMEGHTDEEIAAKLGCVPRTVRRRLRMIRGLWEEEITP